MQRIYPDSILESYENDTPPEHPLNSGFLQKNGDINYVLRAAESPLNLLKSDSLYLTKLFGCSVDDLTSIIIETADAEEQIQKNILEPIIDLSYIHRFSVNHDRLRLSFSQVFKVKNTNIILYFSPFGWVCKKSDFSKVREILESWKLTPSTYNSEALNKVFWTEKSLSIKRDIEFFSVSKKWFDQKDLPYSRSYLLYGPPGNGKTSVIRAISEFFHSKPESFSFTAKYEDPDTSFQNWITGKDYSRDESDYGPPLVRRRVVPPGFSDSDDMQSNPRIRILLLEDIDRFFSKDNSSQLPVSFSTVLNSLDGVIQRKNSIIIATANNPEKIDSQVLCRPGRFDLRVPFEAPNEQSIIDFITKLSDGDNVSAGAIERVASICKGHSLSFAKGVYLSAANRAFSRSSVIINDEDIIGSAEEFSLNLGREIRSVKPGAGF